MPGQIRLASDVITALVPIVILLLLFVGWRLWTAKPQEKQDDGRPKPVVTKRASFPPLEEEGEE